MFLSHGEAISCVLVFCLVHSVLNYVYRLWLHPLAGFPGPKLAGASRLYELYHQVFKSDWLENLVSLHDKYGEHTFKVPELTNAPNYGAVGPIVRIGPNELHSIDNEWNLRLHRRRDLSKCTEYYGVLDNVLGGLQKPQEHATRGSIIRPLFAGAMLAEFSDGKLNKLTEKLHDQLADAADCQRKIDATHLIWAYTTDIMLSYVLGEDSRYLNGNDLDSFHHKTRALGVIDYATTLRTVPIIKAVVQMFPALKSLSTHNWIEKRVRAHLGAAGTMSGSNKSIAALLRSQLEYETAIQEASQAIFIGNESMLSNLTFIIHHLIHNPTTTHRLQQELDAAAEALDGQPVWTISRVAQLPYLDAICRESTRLSAPSWHRQPRTINETLEHGNKAIMPMTSVSFTLTLLERDPERYNEPDKFVPERWIGSNEEVQTLKTGSSTFGTGSRKCLGQHIARQVLRKTIACLFYHFDIALWDAQKDISQKYRYMATFPQKGKDGTLQLSLTSRVRSMP
ncbi:cytochrome p450 domain-containing protein [Sarocladium implicatum]|nr:cytochrome p450 domain-containing protein [Sarocladium implicatum]